MSDDKKLEEKWKRIEQLMKKNKAKYERAYNYDPDIEDLKECYGEDFDNLMNLFPDEE